MDDEEVLNQEEGFTESAESEYVQIQSLRTLINKTNIEVTTDLSQGSSNSYV